MSDEVLNMVGTGIGLGVLGISAGILIKSIGDATEQTKPKKRLKKRKSFKGLF